MTVWYVRRDTLALLERIKPHFCLLASPAALSNVVATGSVTPSPLIASHKMAKAEARTDVSSHISEVPRSSLHNCVTAVMQASLYHCMQFVWLDVIRPTSERQRSLHELLPEPPGFICLFKTSWRLSVVSGPYLETGAWRPCKHRCLFYVPILLAFVC